jgi:hypothetical protein
MRKKWILFIFLGPLAIALFIFIGGELVMHLWNWLLPPLFGWRQINFWQAFGLLALCRILFGGISGRGLRGPNFRRRMAERCESMTPEERERFRQGVRARWGGTATPGGGSTEAV